LQPNDYIQIGYHLHQVVSPVYANSSNQADIEIWPSLREALSDEAIFLIRNTRGIFRLADNTRSWSVTELKTYGLQFKAVEAR
jgi:hypothetical protein